MKKGKMTEAEKQAWWAANRAKARAKAVAATQRGHSYMKGRCGDGTGI